MSTPAIAVSSWTQQDVADVAELVRLIGHAVDDDRMRERLGRLTPEAGHRTWLVRDGEGRVAAVAGAQCTWAYSSDEPTAQLLLLVVRPDGRRDGLGSELLSLFETWAAEQGARRLSAVSAAATDSAHRFYQKRGYHEAGVRYTKIV
ncbi:GNAT family N-acetyltransferase [Curtobacterium sp. Leaf261]|uniref:GNAT family N-acetyltransferase n=1 Tax=Curtobacterium sp. Leaf261 TaxID=1736311 RepID=UPI0006F53319|nr:GNAT family N-acetyltransferase [Curtobacterium sp. Leaf261]KQO60257.1 hypothetical protein ASF23_14940 [Curtobacterium sp. Leaf261]